MKLLRSLEHIADIQRVFQKFREFHKDQGTPYKLSQIYRIFVNYRSLANFAEAQRISKQFMQVHINPKELRTKFMEVCKNSENLS